MKKYAHADRTGTHVLSLFPHIYIYIWEHACETWVNFAIRWSIKIEMSNYIHDPLTELRPLGQVALTIAWDEIHIHTSYEITLIFVTYSSPMLSSFLLSLLRSVFSLGISLSLPPWCVKSPVCSFRIPLLMQRTIYCMYVKCWRYI